MVLDHLSGCTKCQGVPNVCGLIVWVPNVRVYQMSGCTKCHWCTKCHVIVKNIRPPTVSRLFLVQMTSNFGKWLAWLVSSFGILYKNSVSYWKKGVFADLPKTLTYYHIRTWTAFWSNSRFLVWFVGGKNCPFPLCVISCPYIWYIFNLRSFGPRNNRGIAVWPSLHLHSPFFGKSAKTPFFQ